jgi:integrative and conjugative element protein (TIGR02256 family)
MIFPILDSGQRLIFAAPVLEHFTRHRQTRFWQREAGGQLFARFSLPDIIVVEATGPRRTDRRTRYSYHPDRRAEQREIASRHVRGLHFIGDWHTHPEDAPTPSSRDEQSMREAFSASHHVLSGFILAIVGRLELRQSLGLWLHNGDTRLQLRPSMSDKT